jgi:hypothetical protein
LLWHASPGTQAVPQHGAPIVPHVVQEEPHTPPVQTSPGSQVVVQGAPAPARATHEEPFASPGKHVCPRHGGCPVLPQVPHVPASPAAVQPMPALHALPEQQASFAAPQVEQTFWSQDIAFAQEPAHETAMPQVSSVPQPPSATQLVGVHPQVPGLPPPPHVPGGAHVPQLATDRG